MFHSSDMRSTITDPYKSKNVDLSNILFLKSIHNKSFITVPLNKKDQFLKIKSVDWNFKQKIDDLLNKNKSDWNGDQKDLINSKTENTNTSTEKTSKVVPLTVHSKLNVLI